MSRIENNMTLVCYDITSDRLRRKIDKCMKDFGRRLQFSVFLCELDAAGVARCREKLHNVLKTYSGEHTTGDSVILFRRFNPEIADCLLGTRIEDKTAAYEIY